MTTETNLKNALVAIGLTTSDVENIANGSMVVEETNLDIKSKEFAIAFFHSSIDGTIEDYELFMNSDEDFTPWQPFEYSDKDSRVELVCEMQGNLENWFKPKIKESSKSAEAKMYHTRNGAYYDCWRWHADALTFLSDRNIDIVPIWVVKDLEDGVIVEIVLQDEFDIERLKNHIADYYNDQLGMYPENVDDTLDAKSELENLIMAITQAQDDGFDCITIEAE